VTATRSAATPPAVDQESEMEAVWIDRHEIESAVSVHVTERDLLS
jgi:hypothetical protein